MDVAGQKEGNTTSRKEKRQVVFPSSLSPMQARATLHKRRDEEWRVAWQTQGKSFLIAPF